MDEIGVGASVLEGATVEDEVGSCVGRGTDGASAAAIRVVLVCENGAATQDGRAGVGVKAGEILRAACAVSDERKRTRTGVRKNAGEDGGGSRRGRRYGNCHRSPAGIVHHASPLQHPSQGRRNGWPSNVKRAGRSCAIEIQNCVLADVREKTSGLITQAGITASQTQRASVNGGVTHVSICAG